MPAKATRPKPQRTVSMKEIGERFRIARDRLKLSQVELAEPVGLDQTGLSRFETGKRGIKTSTLLALFSVAAEKGMDVDGFVLRGVGEPVRKEAVLLAAPPELIEQLQRLGLVASRQPGDAATEAPRAREKRK